MPTTTEKLSCLNSENLGSHHAQREWEEELARREGEIDSYEMQFNP